MTESQPVVGLVSVCVAELDRDVGRSVRLLLRQMTHPNKLSANKMPLSAPPEEVYFNLHRFPSPFFSSCVLIYVRGVMQYNPGDMPAAAHRDCLYRRLVSQG